MVEQAQKIEKQQEVYNERQNALNYDPVNSDKRLMFSGLARLNNLANDLPIDDVRF